MALCARLEQFDIQATLTDGPDGQTLHVVDPTDGHHLVWRLYQGPLAGTIERDLRLAQEFDLPGLARYQQIERSGDRVIIVRDWVHGIGLEESDIEPAELATALLHASDALHRRGRLLRHLSPDNVFVTPDGAVVVTDWEGRRPMAAASRRFAAPELEIGASADERSDLYAIAALVCERVTGRLPDDDWQPSALELGAVGDAISDLLVRDATARPATARVALGALGESPTTPEDAIIRSPYLLGRDTDIEEIRLAVAKLANGRGEVIFLRGGSGIGKTRLLEEAILCARVHGQGVARCVDGRPLSVPFGAFQSAFEYAAKAIVDWPAQDRRDLLRADGAVLLELSSSFHRFGELHGLPEPRKVAPPAARERSLRAGARVLRACARRKGMMLVIDDLEEIDPMSQELLRYLARNAIKPADGEPVPILILAAYDDRAQAARGHLQAMISSLRIKRQARELVISPLAPHEVRDRIADQLGVEPPPSPFVARMMAETEGNPLAIEERLEWLLLEGVLATPPETWTDGWEQAHQRLRVGPGFDEPTEEQDAVSFLLGASGLVPVREISPEEAGSCLRRLGPDARRIIETIALAGEDLGADLLVAACDLDRAVLRDGLLEALRLRAIVELQPGRFRFRHPRLREAAMSGLDAASRGSIHRRIGQALESLAGRVADSVTIFLAHHFHQAADVERSLTYLPMAALELQQRHAEKDALALYRRFFRHLQTLAPEARERHLGKRLRALEAMADAFARLDRRPEALKVCREMATLAESAGRQRELVSAWCGIARHSLAAADFEASESFSQRATDLASELELPGLEADSRAILGRSAYRRGRHDDALAQLRTALEIQERTDDRLGAARSLEWMARVQAARFDHAAALVAFTEAARRYAALEEHLGRAEALAEAGRAHLRLGDVRFALDRVDEALELHRAGDNRAGIGPTLDLLGDAQREMGDLRAAVETLHESLNAKRDVSDVGGSADTLVLLARTELQRNRTDEALAALEQALTVARRAGNRVAEAAALVWQGQARLRSGEVVRAAELAEDGLQQARAGADRVIECRARIVLAKSVGDGLEHARAAADLADGLGDRLLRIRAHACLGEALASMGRTGQAVDSYVIALDGAREQLRSVENGRDGLTSRVVLLEELRAAAEFVAEHDDGEVGEKSATFCREELALTE